MKKYYDDKTKTKDISFSVVEMNLIAKVLKHTSYSLPVLHRISNITRSFRQPIVNMSDLCELTFKLNISRADLTHIVDLLEDPNDECKSYIPEHLDEIKKIADLLKSYLKCDEF
jgi:hypothetical protein